MSIATALLLEIEQIPEAIPYFFATVLFIAALFVLFTGAKESTSCRWSSGSLASRSEGLSFGLRSRSGPLSHRPRRPKGA